MNMHESALCIHKRPLDKVISMISSCKKLARTNYALVFGLTVEVMCGSADLVTFIQGL